MVIIFFLSFLQVISVFFMSVLVERFKDVISHDLRKKHLLKKFLLSVTNVSNIPKQRKRRSMTLCGSATRQVKCLNERVWRTFDSTKETLLRVEDGAASNDDVLFGLYIWSGGYKSWRFEGSLLFGLFLPSSLVNQWRSGRRSSFQKHLVSKKRTPDAASDLPRGPSLL